MKQVYVLLSRTGTLTSRVVNTFAKGKYAHASLALTPETDKFYSYARRRLYNFLIGGIFNENTKEFVFGRFPESRCALFELDVTDEGHEAIKAYVEWLMDNYDDATYNFLGVIPQRMGIVWDRGKKFTCTQFVAVSLSKAPEIELPKDPYIMLPCDFMNVKGIRKIYEGPVKDCNFSQASVFNENNKTAE